MTQPGNLFCGFSYEHNGKFNDDDFYAYAMQPEKEKAIVIERVQDVKQIPGLMYNKVKIQWLYDDLDQTFHAKSTTQFSQNIVQIIVTYIKIMNLFVIALVFVGLIKNKNVEKENYFFIINTLIYFGVYLLIEVCARYYYNPQINLIILSALGTSRISKYVNTHFEGLKEYIRNSKIPKFLKW